MEGLSDPAAARGPYGEFYLFPRLTVRGTPRALGLHECGSTELDPVSVERLGIAQEPEAA
jgi:beta-1,2-mannobiose phosphorylase / 1,2-beta-oligomannan phosphorylase